MLTYLIIFLITLLVIQYTKKVFYWKRRGINGSIPLPLIGLSLEDFFMSATEIHSYREKKYGKIYGTWLGSLPILNISDREIAKIILQKEFSNFINNNLIKGRQKLFKDSFIMKTGQEWRDGRNLVTPIFTAKRIKEIYPQIQTATKPLFENIENLIKEGKQNEINVLDLLKGYSLDVIAKFVFAIEINSAKNKDHLFVIAVRKLVNLENIKFFLISFIPNKIIELSGLQLLDEKSVDYLCNLIKILIKQRRENKETKYNDFLDLLIKSVDEKGKKLSQDEINANCIFFFFGALETVSMTICNALYCLITNAEYEKKLYEELIDLYHDKEMNYEQINESKLLDAIVKESQRLYPALNFILRIAENDIEIKGIKIDKDQVVAINIYNLHMSSDYWSEPTKFKPERWFDEELKTEGENFLNYLPFSAGPRVCVATRLALVQVKYCLAKIIMNYRVYRSEKTEVPPKYINNQQALTYNEMLLGFERRKD